MFSIPPPRGLFGATAISVNAYHPPSYLALANIPQGSAAILFPPLSQTVEAGGQAFFSVNAVGTPPLSYQWYFGATQIPGATNRWLSLDNVSTIQAGIYSVKVSNSESSAISQPVTLAVIPSLDVNMVPAITLKGGAGQNFRIDYINAVGPTNAWITLATLTLTNNQQFYFDVSAIGRPARLYRLVQLP
jgi:hypothetical protein